MNNKLPERHLKQTKAGRCHTIQSNSPLGKWYMYLVSKVLLIHRFTANSKYCIKNKHHLVLIVPAHMQISTRVCHFSQNG